MRGRDFGSSAWTLQDEWLNPESRRTGTRTVYRNRHCVRGYAGIWPPAGETYDYVITVKAIGVEQLPVAANATGAMVGFVSNMNGLAVATMTAKGSN
ncbi:hypothetical protein EV217_3830 [Phyllobacterium myrsinacearum]|nr:hypothetical protein EV217_3830 [Phyllobacterium myrsinacearum]